MRMHTGYFLLALAMVSGPIGRAQWVQLNTGSVFGIATHEGGLCVLGYDGVQRSWNEGATWEPMNDGIGVPYEVKSLRGIGSVLWAGTTSGIKKKQAGATNWQHSNGSLTANGTVWAKRFYTANSVLYAVFNGNIIAGGGLYRSTNGGATWIAAHLGLNGTWSINDIVFLNGVLYAATTGGLYMSTSQGDFWQPVPNSPGSESYVLRHLNGRTYLIGAEALCTSTASPTLAPPWVGSNPIGLQPGYSGDIALYDGLIYATHNGGCLRSDAAGVDFVDFSGGLMSMGLQEARRFHVHQNKLYFAFGEDLHVLDAITLSGGSVDATDDRSVRLAWFADGITVESAPELTGSQLHIYDAVGRSWARMPVGADRTWIPFGELVAGTYVAVLFDLAGHRHLAGRFMVP